MFSELQIRGQAIRHDWCEVEPIYCCFSFHGISAHSQQFANFQSPLLRILTPHRSTAELRVVGIETSRTEWLRGAYSRVKRSSHVPSTHPGKDYQLLRWRSFKFTQPVYSQLANVYIILF